MLGASDWVKAVVSYHMLGASDWVRTVVSYHMLGASDWEGGIQQPIVDVFVLQEILLFSNKNLE
jgi:hypothetical protein